MSEVPLYTRSSQEGVGGRAKGSVFVNLRNAGNLKFCSGLPVLPSVEYGFQYRGSSLIRNWPWLGGQGWR